MCVCVREYVCRCNQVICIAGFLIAHRKTYTIYGRLGRAAAAALTADTTTTTTLRVRVSVFVNCVSGTSGWLGSMVATSRIEVFERTGPPRVVAAGRWRRLDIWRESVRLWRTRTTRHGIRRPRRRRVFREASRRRTKCGVHVPTGAARFRFSSRQTFRNHSTPNGFEFSEKAHCPCSIAGSLSLCLSVCLYLSLWMENSRRKTRECN